MNEEFAEAIAQGHALQEGFNLAEEVILDTVVATLVTNMPRLNEEIRKKLVTFADLRRPTLQRGELADQMYSARIQGILDLLQDLKR